MDLLLEKGIPFNIRGSSIEDTIEIYYQVRNEEAHSEKILFTIKEYYSPKKEPLFDFFDFSTDLEMEIQSISLEEMQEKIERIAATLLFDLGKKE